jgi:glycosyltransferase involved in cell wall biosynthesis
LIGFQGHHWEFAQIIKEACKSKFDVKFYSNLHAKTRILLSLPAQPICDEGVYPALGNFDDIYRSMTEATIRDLNRIHGCDIGPDAILIMHTATLFQLGALAQWFTALSTSERPRLCVQLQFPLEYHLPADTAVRKRAVDSACAATSILVETGKARLASNSGLLADHISKQLKQKCAVLPVPIRWPKLDQAASPDPGVVFGFFGGLRPEKGASIIAQAIPAFASQYPDTRFLVHAPVSEADPFAVSVLRAVPQVELIKDDFGRKSDYFKHFLRASCILLPYDPVEYAYRTSGILIEALGLGRLIITTEGSWLHAESQRRGVTVFGMTSYTATDLLACLSRAREYLINSPFRPTVNGEVMTENSAEAFCSALVELLSDS